MEDDHEFTADLRWILDMTGTIDPAVMAQVAAALNTQVTRDLPQYWNVNATVTYLPHKDEIPQGVWPLQIVKTLPPDEGGFHLTKHNQSYAKVINTPGSNECRGRQSRNIGNVGDSAGNRLHASTAIPIDGDEVVDAATGKFEYLVEVCDHHARRMISRAFQFPFMTPMQHRERATALPVQSPDHDSC